MRRRYNSISNKNSLYLLPPKKGIYKYYLESNLRYEVFGSGFITTTQQHVVIFRSINDPDKSEPYWIMPYKEFTEEMTDKKPRYQFVSEKN